MIIDVTDIYIYTYAILILFSDLYVCLTKSFRCSPVVLTMFLYFDYYTGNPVLVSSDGIRDSFRVQSKSNCCLSSFVQPD